MSFGIPVRNGLMLGLVASTALSTRGGRTSPAMALNFLQPFLDSRITFSRGTNATLVDRTGRITYAPANLVLWSQDFSNAAWAATTATKTSGVLDPLGGTTASTITATAGNGQILQTVGGSAGTSQAYVASIWLRRRTGTGSVFLFNPNGGGLATVTLTGSWAQYSVTGLGAAASNFVGIRLATSGDAVDVAFAQFEPVTYQTTPSTYNATTASAYYGPRFDYDPVTLAPRGLLIEEQRTNLLTYSADWTNLAWIKSETTISANSTLAPDGTTTADTLIGSTNNIAKFTAQIGLTSTTSTFTVYAKAAGETVISLWLVGATVGASFTLTGSGSTALLGATSSSITPAGNGWYRCTVQHNTATTTAHIYLRTGSSYIGDGTSGAYLWGAQLEAGAFATSYIPTVASAVSRSADVASMTGTNFSTWYNQAEGTFVVEAARGEVNVTAYTLTASDNTAAEWIGTYFATSQRVGATIVDGSVTQMAVVTANNSAPINTITKAAVAYKLNDSNLAANGVALTTDTSCTIPTTNRLYIGSDVNGGSQYINGRIRVIAYYNTRLSNTQLQQVTT
jgi:hypothetical protein